MSHTHLQRHPEQEQVPSPAHTRDPAWIQQRVLIQGEGEVGSQARLKRCGR